MINALRLYKRHRSQNTPYNAVARLSSRLFPSITFLVTSCEINPALQSRNIEITLHEVTRLTCTIFRVPDSPIDKRILAILCSKVNT